MRALLYACRGVDAAAWTAALTAALPELDVRSLHQPGEPSEIDYALAWRPPPGALAGLPSLKVIFSLGAGVDGLLKDETLPPHVPIVRMADAGLSAGMSEYVLMRVLHYHRRMPEHEANQRAGVWRELIPKLAGEMRVGVLGLGALGETCALALAAQGYDVSGWSRTERAVPGVRTFHGPTGLKPLLERSDIVVCLLPLTPHTRGVLDAQAFAAMPKGAYVINVGRGACVSEGDLLAALDRGQIAGATLDVFETEPLSQGHPFWTHPGVVVTPHCSAITHPRTASGSIAEWLDLQRRGLPLPRLVDRTRGY